MKSYPLSAKIIIAALAVALGFMAAFTCFTANKMEQDGKVMRHSITERVALLVK